jgi:hypothetical protein
LSPFSRSNRLRRISFDSGIIVSWKIWLIIPLATLHRKAARNRRRLVE